MNLSRRSFMGSILVLSAAPAIIKASSLMKVVALIPKEITMGFDLASPKGEGTVIAVSRNINGLLWPGVKEWYGHYYRDSKWDSF